jgi:hypothetical protein
VRRRETKRQRTAALQDATARHWIKLRPPGLGVRLSSAAFLVQKLRWSLFEVVLSKLNDHATDAAVNAVISRLTDGGMETFADGKVTYPSK